MNDPDRKPGDESSPHDPSTPAQSAGRRALLVAMPAIFSLHPGVAAANARSSSVLVLSREGTPPVDEFGNYLCVKKPSRFEGGVKSNEKGWIIDRDTPLDVTQIPSSRTYARNVNEECTIATPQNMCEDGDNVTYYYRETKQRGSYTPLDADEAELFGGKGDKGGSKKKECGDKQEWVKIKNKVPRGAFASLTALNSFTDVSKKSLI